MPDLPIGSVWLTCQRPAAQQRRGRYVPETSHHPAKMLPDLAAHAIAAYTTAGDLVIDPMCGSGTTLVEAMRSGRHAYGVDIEPAFVTLAESNIRLATVDGAITTGTVTQGDATQLVTLLPARLRGTAALVLTSPPYGATTHGLVHTQPRLHKHHHTYAERHRGNLAYLDWPHLLDGWRRILDGCWQLLRPGGTLVFTCRPVRRTREDLIDLPGQLLSTAISAGFDPVERCVALLAAVRDGHLIHRASLFALMSVRRARTAGIPTALITHEDVYILRKPR